MANEKKVHVMALDGEQQLVMRLLLSRHLKMQIRYVLDFLALNPTFANVENKWTSLTQAFDTYEELASSFPTLETLGKAHTKMFAYNGLAIDFLLTAIDRFPEDDHTGIEVDELAFIQNNYDELKKLVEESYKYEFTVDEIKKASR